MCAEERVWAVVEGRGRVGDEGWEKLMAVERSERIWVRRGVEVGVKEDGEGGRRRRRAWARLT